MHKSHIKNYNEHCPDWAHNLYLNTHKIPYLYDIIDIYETDEEDFTNPDLDACIESQLVAIYLGLA